MMRTFIALALATCFGSACTSTPSEPPSFNQLAMDSPARIEGETRLPGLKGQVEVLRDEWGVPHIYAGNMDDLFFAQGFVTAQDRLWQMEMWRRVGEGRVSEIVGPSAYEHDRLVRLLKFRGPYDEREWKSYHPEGKRIFEAYTAGINAFIRANSGNLPVEFKLTGIRPEPWTPEQLLIRARVSEPVGDARAEIRLALSVKELGAAEANRRARPEPPNELTVPEGLDLSLITEDLLKALEGDQYGELPKPELLPEFRNLLGSLPSVDRGVPETSPGSNNWAIRNTLSANGTGIMVDDPHRQVTNPAHRYLVHLNAPGWNVAGATEPGLPGVIRGHNGKVAWGRTATQTDQGDIYVEELNPANPDEVLFNGKWEPVRIIMEEIAVKGESPRKVEMRFTRHGPIFHEDRARHRAFALRSQLSEPGTAEYIGGLRLDQASSARDCLTEANFMPTPPTNLVCADVEGNIAFRVAVFAPKRQGWQGRLPVPGTGKYEWSAERRTDLPSLFNPPEGYIATANNNTQPRNNPEPYAFVQQGQRYRRHERLVQLLKDGRTFTIEGMMGMLRDNHNSEAMENKIYFQGWKGETPEVERAREMIESWDSMMDRGSSAAAIYIAWQRTMDLPALRQATGGARHALAAEGLKKAIAALTKDQGADWNQWRWGRTNRSEFPHPLLAAYDLPPVERHGGAGTVNAVGAVYRLVTDFSKPDNSQVTIAPGISGQPGSPFYSNLLELWGNNEFFPLLFTRPAVEASTKYRLVLLPGQS